MTWCSYLLFWPGYYLLPAQAVKHIYWLLFQRPVTTKRQYCKKCPTGLKPHVSDSSLSQKQMAGTISLSFLPVYICVYLDVQGSMKSGEVCCPGNNSQVTLCPHETVIQR